MTIIVINSRHYEAYSDLVPDSAPQFKGGGDPVSCELPSTAEVAGGSGVKICDLSADWGSAHLSNTRQRLHCQE